MASSFTSSSSESLPSSAGPLTPDPGQCASGGHHPSVRCTVRQSVRHHDAMDCPLLSRKERTIPCGGSFLIHNDGVPFRLHQTKRAADRCFLSITNECTCVIPLVQPPFHSRLCVMNQWGWFLWCSKTRKRRKKPSVSGGLSKRRKLSHS